MVVRGNGQPSRAARPRDRRERLRAA